MGRASLCTIHSVDIDPTDTALLQQLADEAAARAAIDKQTEIGDFKWLMSQKRGRRYVWRQLELAGVFQTSFTSDALQMAFSEGQRNQGLRILGFIHEHAPESYLEMLKEQHDRRNRNG